MVAARPGKSADQGQHEGVSLARNKTVAEVVAGLADDGRFHELGRRLRALQALRGGSLDLDELVDAVRGVLDRLIRAELDEA